MRLGLASILSGLALATGFAACGGDDQPTDRSDREEVQVSDPPVQAVASGPSPEERAAELRQQRRERAARLQQRRERAVEGAVRDFYSEVDFGEYDAAWARLTPPVQDSLGGFVAWRSGYDFSVSTRVSNVTAVQADPRFAVVLFRLRSEDIDECADTVVQRFAGRWELARVRRNWRATSVSAEKIGGATPVTNVEDCPGYGEDLPPLSGGDVPDDALPEYEPRDYESPELPSDDFYEPDYQGNPDYEYGPPTTEDFGNGQGSIGLCEDGRLSDSIGRQGACSHHGGVAD